MIILVVNNADDVFLLPAQELSPTTDANLVKSLMNLIDCQMDEFHDEAKLNTMEEREICSWLEVRTTGGASTTW